MMAKISDICFHMVDNRGKTPPLIPAGKPLLEAQCFSQADFVSSKEGGKGAVRELCDFIFNSQNNVE